MNDIMKFLKDIVHTQIIASIIIIIISLLLYRTISFFLKKSEKKSNFKIFTGKKSETYIKLTRSLIRYIFLIVTTLIILQVNGIDVSSVLAGVGILGVVFGFAIQDWLKDIIRGASILSDNYFSVGDIVKYKDTEGKVLVIGLKTTKIQDLRTGYIKSIANRNIEEVDIVSNLVYVNIPMPYEVNLKRAEKAVSCIVDDISNNNNVTGCRYIGVNELADSSINYCIEIKCDPNFKLQVRRDALRSILSQLDKNAIQVPYTQIDIHNK